MHDGDDTAHSLCTAASEFLGCELMPDGWLEGGDEALVLKALGAGQQYVLHASPSRLSREQLIWCHAVARYAAKVVPQAVAPLERNGATLTAWRDHQLAVFPFVEGQLASRSNNSHRIAAAQTLAVIQRALLDWSGGPRPSVNESATEQNSPLLMADAKLDAWWHDAQPRALTSVIHGDFYPRNLICEGDAIAGVIDWHDATVAPLALELAGATFEFCRDEAHAVDMTSAQAFVSAYRKADGPVLSHDIDNLRHYLRLWLRRDVALNLACGANEHDPYIARQIALFRQLKNQTSTSFQ